MPTVQFSDPEDFLAELEKDKEKVDRNLVRLVYQSTPSRMSPNIQHLSVLATALVAGQVYRLEAYCGDLWRIESQDQPVYDKGKKVKEQIASGCAKLGLEVRGGVIGE